jgi:hypothetical protein
VFERRLLVRVDERQRSVTLVSRKQNDYFSRKDAKAQRETTKRNHPFRLCVFAGETYFSI